MRPLDWTIVLIYFSINLLIAWFLRRRASRSREDFFLSGRKLPWWLAGTTMVATTFAADTPLAVTELVATKGIAGNWLWWNMVAGTILTVFFFARLWRRSGVMTDVEFIEIRYSGKPAAFLRGFRSIYLGVFMNVIIMGWVNVALAEILTTIFNVPENHIIWIIGGAMLLVGLYSALAGLWGIAFTDAFQFIIAMAGSIILALTVLDLPAVGGMEGLMTSLPADTFRFLPRIESGDVAGGVIMTLSVSALAAHLLVQWWASWYPGAEPGGGGYIAQRMLSARDEGHSQLATLWFSIAHFALRPWPWIIVALASLVLYPELGADEKKTGFVMAMRDHLPAGLLGLLVAAFLAAYMSTISTHLNWGTSYIVHDFYARFFKKDSSEKELVRLSRLVTLVLVILATLLVLVIKTIAGAWAFIIECGAGLGLVLILRWYWWRVNAWSEITAMVVPFLVYGANRLFIGIEFPSSLFLIVGVTTLAWIVITFLTGPTDREHLVKFYRKVRPSGPGWARIRREEGLPAPLEPGIVHLFINWVSGTVLVYASLFSIGKVIMGEQVPGLILAGISILLLVFLILRLTRTGRNHEST
jgi:Na+/proline symporter